jgi:plasmid replication initiation protein
MKKGSVVVKSNKLMEASYRLDLVEQRIILASIVAARESQKGLGDDFVTIEAKSFGAMFNMDEHSVYNQLKDALNTLFNRFIVIRDIHPESGHERVSKIRWISNASYIDGVGTIQIRFSQDIVPYITRLESEFTVYRIEKIGGMSSVYAVRLYELLLQYLSSGKREIEITWLKEILQLTGEYQRIDNFKRNVIDLAVQQINKHSDIKVSYVQKKTGRLITHFVFDIKSKETPKPKNITLNKEYINKHANPGESYEQAYQRLKNNKLFIPEKIIQKKIISTEIPSLIVSSNTIENKININTNNKEHIINELDKLEECVTDKTNNNVLDQDKLVKPWWKFW